MVKESQSKKLTKIDGQKIWAQSYQSPNSKKFRFSGKEIFLVIEVTYLIDIKLKHSRSF